MKVTTLGVNAAFSTGTYKDVIEVDDVRKSLEEAKAYLRSEVSCSLNSEIDYAGSMDIEEIMSSLKIQKAYFPKWQSNFLLEFDRPGKIKKDTYRFVLDFGGDIRHSLKGLDLSVNDIDGFYCSHGHSDHDGGQECIALSTFFNPYWNEAKKKWHTSFLGKLIPIADLLMEKGSNALPNECKPDLYAHTSVMAELWHAGKPGLATLQGIRKVELSTYFNTINLHDNQEFIIEDGDITWTVYTIVSSHVMSGAAMMPSYGLMFEGSHGKKIYFPTDSMFMAPHVILTFYKQADVIYQDCETSAFKSGVHPHITDLQDKLDPEIKKKLLLYHYQEDPIVEPGEFLGVLRAGECREY